MKGGRFAGAFLILASILLFSPSCAGLEKQVSIVVSCEDFEASHDLSHEIQVLEGGTVALTLCSNQSTGFQWEQQVYCPLVGTIITPENHEFMPPQEAAGVGAAGQEVWTFKAVNKGTATITLFYSQPWESGQKGAWTYNLVVVIK